MLSKLDGVVFDFDGVIVNTEPLHFKAMRDVVYSDYGIDFDWAFYINELVGFDDRDAFKAIFAKNNKLTSEEEIALLIKKKTDLFNKIANIEDIAPYPGVKRFIFDLKKENVPIALCSGSLRKDIEPILIRLDLLKYFLFIISAEDVQFSKPDPACYLLAVEGLLAFNKKIDPKNIWAIEDTPAGIAAASGAGINVLALTNTYNASFLNKANKIVTSLETVNIHELIKDFL